MRRPAIFLAASVLAVLHASASAAPPDLTFRGHLDSGGNSAPVTTVFRSEPTRGITGGRYVFQDRQRAVHGTLGPCARPAADVVRCAWKDRYGRGQLQVRFSADLDSFDGQWWPEGNPNDVYRWSGRR